MTPSDLSEGSTSNPKVNFDEPAVLRKWPSLNNQRRAGVEPYGIIEDTLGECIREFMARPSATRHLYDIVTAAQPPLISATLTGDLLAELGRLREYLHS